MSKVNLKLDWCSYEAAKYAVENWHYSKRMPSGKLSFVGVWEFGKYIGCVIFGRGANNNIAKPYKLSQLEVCELVRVALNKHVNSVTRILSIALSMLKKLSPNLRVVVSYADEEEGHVGSIYKGGGWIYEGRISHSGMKQALINGKRVHRRTISSRYGGTPKGIEFIMPKPKHKYLFPLDEEMKKKLQHLHKPYPKRATSIDNDVSVHHTEEGGASPTVALHFAEETV